MNSTAPPCSLPLRPDEAHKGDFGRVLLIGGSRGMSGSIALASIAALKTGSGLVTAAVPDRCLETVASFHPCIMTLPMADDLQGRFSMNAAKQLKPHLKRVDALGCGPGMTGEPGSVRLVELVLQQSSVPRVFDADAINVLAQIQWPALAADNGQAPLVLTPHPGELERLVGVSSHDRQGQIAAAGELAKKSSAVIVVKGGPTVVVDGKKTWTNTTGNPGMATGGSGDVLTGMVASLLGQRLSGWDAARLGVWLHGRTGDLAAAAYGQSTMTPVELLEHLRV